MVHHIGYDAAQPFGVGKSISDAAAVALVWVVYSIQSRPGPGRRGHNHPQGVRPSHTGARYLRCRGMVLRELESVLPGGLE